jgi:hypothetical protein
MGNSSSNQINIDISKSGMSIARQIANIIYNDLPLKYKNQKYKDKIYAIIREKIGPNESFKRYQESVNDFQLKPGDAQVEWEAIKLKNPHTFLMEVNEQLYQENRELYDYSISNPSNGLELKRKGGRKTKSIKNKRTKKYKNKKIHKSIKNKH